METMEIIWVEIIPISSILFVWKIQINPFVPNGLFL